MQQLEQRVKGAPITAQDFPAIRWHGHWIWVPEEPIEPCGFWSAGVDPRADEAHGLFRKSFRLDHVPERVPARITADARYVLYVNGRTVGRGPIRSQPRRLHYDLFDLAPYLQLGENVVAIYVVYYGSPTSFWMPAVPNNTLGTTGVLVFEAQLGQADWLVSDSSWKAHRSDAWSDDGRRGSHHGGGVPVEVFDARRLAHQWRDVTFDDSAWGSAQIVRAMHVGGFARSQPPTDPYGPLYPRPVAMLDGKRMLPQTLRVDMLAGADDGMANGPIAHVQATLDWPVRASRTDAFPLTLQIPPGELVRLMIDMGRIVSGLVVLELAAPAGTVVDLSYTEQPHSSTVSMDKMRAGMRYIARGEHDRVEAVHSNGFRYAYLLVHGVLGSVSVTQVAVQEQLYPWHAGADFACSDEELNRIFRAGLRTVQLCSHDSLIDCPTREQRAWVGDAVVQQMVHLATNGDWRLAWHYLTLANSPRSDGILPMVAVSDIEASGMYTIPDWSLHWIHGVYNLYRFAGDRDAVRALLPTAERIVRWYLPFQTQSGVLQDVTEWNLSTLR